jgi:hypothetical protein
MTQIKTKEKDGYVVKKSDKPYFYHDRKLIFVDYTQTTAYHNFCIITFAREKMKDYIVNVLDVTQ